MTTSVEVLEAPGQPGSAKPGRHSRRKLTGWLLKRKSEGVASRLFRSANRRFFTLDFEAQLFYYAQSESHKTMSLPVRFCNLLSVEPYEAVSEPPLAEEAAEGDAAKSFRHVAVPKISFGALKRSTASHHGFVLRMAGKEMDLLCASKQEAEAWISGLREAIAMGSSGEEPLKLELSTSAGSSPEAPLSPRSEGGESVPEMLVPQTPEAAKVQTSPRSQMAFGGEPARETQEKKGRRGLGGLLPRRLRRQSKEASVAEVTTLEEGVEAWGDEDYPQDPAPVSEVSKRYEDKARGLSLKERLAQMDFSDDEDEE